MGWIFAFVLFLVIVFLLGAAWYVLAILCLVAGIVGLVAFIATSMRWPG